MSLPTGTVIHPITGSKIPAFLHGVIVPMFTPCTPDHALDERGIRAYVDYLVDTRSVTGLFPRSGLGMFRSFSLDYAKRMTDIVVDQAAGRVPVMPGCGGVSNGRPGFPRDPAAYVRESIDLCHHAERRGAVAAVLPVPYPFAPEGSALTDDLLLAYYREVAVETSLPLVAYQTPSSEEGYRVHGETVERLIATVPRIAGMKYTTDDMKTIDAITRAADGHDFAIIAGNETALPYVFLNGGTGVIGGGATFNPEILRALYERMMCGDWAGARPAALDVIRANRTVNDAVQVRLALPYIAGKGYAVQPYSLSEEDPVSPDVMDRCAVTLDALRGPYIENRWW